MTANWAPVPAAACDDPAVGSALLPADAVHDCQLDVISTQLPEARERLDGLFAALGLPTGRLVIRDGLHLFEADGGGQLWLTVDYLVPGTRRLSGTGWDVQLNHEAGRTATAATRAAWIRRWTGTPSSSTGPCRTG